MVERTMNGWEELPRMLLNLAVAFALAIPIGWDRERQDVGPGLRTYPLLAMGACAYVQIGQFAFRDEIDSSLG
jgi:putative Mg2+ transporter-C (MgtC) family protein